MSLPLSHYSSFIFDCDGVVLDSNHIKTEAFWLSAEPYGGPAADALVAYHVAHGGISRYAKFNYFLDILVPKCASSTNGPGLDALLADFASHVCAGLQTCQIAEGLDRLRKGTEHARWLIVSGGDQAELRTIFQKRGISGLFDGGIFGSPATKVEILEREIASGTIKQPALMLGDSRVDHEAALASGLDFVFVSQWTEFADWENYCRRYEIRSIRQVSDLLSERPAVLSC